MDMVDSKLDESLLFFFFTFLLSFLSYICIWMPPLIYIYMYIYSAVAAAELTEQLSLPSLRNRKWYIQACVGTTGEGLYEGLDWLSAEVGKAQHLLFVSKARWSPANLDVFIYLSIYLCMYIPTYAYNWMFIHIHSAHAAIKVLFGNSWRGNEEKVKEFLDKSIRAKWWKKRGKKEWHLKRERENDKEKEKENRWENVTLGQTYIGERTEGVENMKQIVWCRTSCDHNQNQFKPYLLLLIYSFIWIWGFLAFSSAFPFSRERENSNTTHPNGDWKL